MEKLKQLKPLIIDEAKVMPMASDIYESRMILDHVITGRDNVIQVNHGTVKAHAKLDGAAHDDDEIYYILSGTGNCVLMTKFTTFMPERSFLFRQAVFTHLITVRATVI